MAGRLEVTPELLSSHADSLRGLARRLLADADAAEDVVQETWLMALRRPPRQGAARGGSLRGWLHAVARSLALKRLRGDARRVRREAASARSEAVAGPAEPSSAAERAAVVRGVTDAVLALDEPYRDTVLLRYFENLPPREIAKRQGVPVSTVKSRLQRAAARLRTHLADSFDDGSHSWRRALALGFGLPRTLPAPVDAPRAGPAATATAGTALTGTAGSVPLLLATMNLKLALTVTAAAALSWLVFAGDDETSASSGREPTALGPRTKEPGRVLPAGVLRADADSASARTAVVEETAETPPDAADWRSAVLPAAAFPFELVGRVVDEHGLGVADAELYLAPVGHVLNRVGETDGGGDFTVRWSGTAPAAELVFCAAGAGNAPTALTRLALASGREARVEVQATPGDGGVIRLVSSVTGERSLEANFSSGSFVVATLGFRPAALDAAPEALRSPDGSVRFVGASDGLPCTGTSRWAVADLALDSYLQVDALASIETSYDFSYVQSIELAVPDVLVSGEAAAATASVEGRVLDPLGDPVPNALVCRLGATAGAFTTTTDAEGRYVLEGLPPGEATLYASAPSVGAVEAPLFLGAGVTGRWEATLEPGLEVRGRLVDGTGKPLESWSVEASSTDPARPWTRVLRTDDAGRFRFTNTPAVGLALCVTADGSDSRLPDAVLGPVYGSTVEAALTPETFLDHVVERVEPAALTLRAMRSDGAPLPEAMARLWSVVSGRGTWLERLEESGRFGLGDLPPGEYRLEVGAAPHGWLELPALWLQDGEALDLGDVLLPDPARLELVERPLASGASEGEGDGPARRIADRPALEVWTERAGVLSRSRTIQSWGAPPLLVPAGETLVVLSQRGATGVARLPLRSGGSEVLQHVRSGKEPAFTTGGTPTRTVAEEYDLSLQDLPGAGSRCTACHQGPAGE